MRATMATIVKTFDVRPALAPEPYAQFAVGQQSPQRGARSPIEEGLRAAEIAMVADQVLALQRHHGSACTVVKMKNSIGDSWSIAAAALACCPRSLLARAATAGLPSHYALLA